MAPVKDEAEIEQSIAKLCAHVVSSRGFELQEAIIDLANALESWRGVRTEKRQ